MQRKLSRRVSRLTGDVSRLTGDVSRLTGDVSGLWGRVSGLWGRVSGLTGDVSGLWGRVSGLTGDVDSCGLTEDDRARGVHIAALIEQPTIALAVEAPQPRFKPGTTFRTGGKHPLECTVTDFLVTRNLAGEVVRTRYVATHIFCGQRVTDSDVVETTIARGLIKHQQ